MPEIPGAVCFTSEAVASISAALPSGAPPERVALLPEILQAWASEDLREHLSREGRQLVKRRGRRLATISDKARSTLDAVDKLDEVGQFLIARGPQMQREARMGNSRWGRIGLPFLGPDDIGEAERRRDEALSWLSDLIETIAEPSQKPPPDKKTVSYLIVLDLAAIFEIVTCAPPTRRNNPLSDTSQSYGPFWDFTNAVCESLSGIRSIDRAMKDVMKLYPEKEYSAFVANLQFRHPDLWQKLKGSGAKK
jgi:hypothetical protein